MPQHKDIHLRDPFVLPCNGVYYLYGSRGATAWGMGGGFDVYRGVDLENWEGLFSVFEHDGVFGADRHCWGPRCRAGAADSTCLPASKTRMFTGAPPCWRPIRRWGRLSRGRTAA